ncbi:PilS cassette [Neisseria meningitidis serogroup B]|uniref:PilS cassette n=1 Tax=Neisseria meningitidis serogroup B TaxID=491 RepID=A0A0H5QAM5_NEIMI|nr:PilS cassette [Neisseria meningitidis serogroup B]
MPKPRVLDSHFRGNDGMQVSVWMDSSFPRRRESRPPTRRESIGND